MRRWLRDQVTQVAEGTLPFSASDSEDSPLSSHHVPREDVPM